MNAKLSLIEHITNLVINTLLSFNNTIKKDNNVDMIISKNIIKNTIKNTNETNVTKGDKIKAKPVKRIRQTKYPLKRRPFMNYRDAPWKWEDIFQEMDELMKIERKYIKITS